MCGIVGFTHRDWIPDRERIRGAAASLFHRGPDQQGVFDSPVCSLGATRLKILDLSSGDQPIVLDKGEHVIAFNGEIYNHLELRAELARRGHKFLSQTDTETLLHAFLEWDIDCLSRVRGMFAVAFWTEATKRLVLARDRVGIKPLYISRQGDNIYFGSELKSILLHPEIDRRISLRGLDCYLSLNYVPCPWTLVEGIEKLPPGHWLEWRDGKVSSGAYWQLPSGPVREIGERAATEELDGLLRQSVREHLLSDVPLGIWLSGGIDSSTVLHYAAEASSSRLKTFSITFNGRKFNEASFVQKVVERYGTEHYELDLNPLCDLRGAVEELAYYNDEPTADAGALPIWYLAKLTKQNATVALSGEGGDEVFAGYLTYRANQLAQSARRLPSGALRLGLAALRRWPVSDEKIGFEYKAKRFLEGCLLSPARAHVYWNGTFSDAQKDSLVRQELPAALESMLSDLHLPLSSKDTLSAYLRFDQKYFLSDDILVKVDRMSMAHAVEVRPPFLDHRIIEFCAALPSSLKIQGSRQKCLLKSLMRDKLPESILSRKKTGLDIPAHDWLRGSLRPLLLEVVANAGPEEKSLFDMNAIGRYLRDHFERRANLGYHLWGLLILFMWMNKWKIRTDTIPRQNHSGIAQALSA